MSGDYVDLATAGPGGRDLYFVFGDVAGKGVAASILMSHLKAVFAGLIAAAPPLDRLMADANRRALRDAPSPATSPPWSPAGSAPTAAGELVNAGHPHPLLLAAGEVRQLPSTGLPVGMFCDARYDVERFGLAPGDALVLYTDGLSEATDPAGEEYGGERPARLLAGRSGASAQALTHALQADVEAFRAGTPQGDDLTLLAIRRKV